MTSKRETACPECGNPHQPGRPFCVDCGELIPPIVSDGSVSVVVGDVPSAEIRSQLTAVLKSWFPGLDSFEAEDRLKTGPTLLISGIDESSAGKLVAALKGFHAPAKAERDRERSFFKSLWNGGLLVTPPALLIALLVGSWVGLLLFMIGVAAPIVGAMLKIRHMQPLLLGAQIQPQAEDWARTAESYAEAMKMSDPEAGAMLKSLAERVFDVYGRLRKGTVVAVAAGDDRGELAMRLMETVQTAASLARKSASGDEEKRREALKELNILSEMVDATGDWYRRTESEGIKDSQTIAGDLVDVVTRIDRILKDTGYSAQESPSRLKDYA